MFNFILSLDRIKKINKLIKGQQTGTPDKFANKLNLGRRQLYNILDELKIMGAPIKYCRKKETFFYEDDFDLQISYSVKIVEDEETRNIYGGVTFMNKNNCILIEQKAYFYDIDWEIK